MNRDISLALLGSFQVYVDGEFVTRFEYDKVRGLLAYLAVEAAVPHRRDTLIGLLWPEQTDRAARHNLSQALVTLRQALRDEAGTPLLLCDRTTIQCNPEVTWQLDLTAFEAHLAACERHDHARPELCTVCMEQRRQAVALYRGDFLKGLAGGDSAAFEDWVAFKRERLHRLALDALYALTRYHEWRGEREQAQNYARRQLELEPWREEAHQQLIRLLAQSGQRSAALAQYDDCRRLLDKELGVEPSAATQQLYARIRSAGNVQRHMLPPQPTPFVGRQEEVATICGLLAHPDCRLLTIVGPGGVGKTRLATQVAETIAESMLDGAYFVPLAGLQSATLLLTALAQALNFSFYGTSDPKAQLLDYLRGRELLLILDNFEHLAPGAGLIDELLKSAPRLKIITTSQARLHLSWEWTFDLGGLVIPDEPWQGGLERYSAAQLFVQSAQRTRQHFALAPDDQPALTRVCRLVEGLPLALELAASWIRVSSCAEIASEIERGLDILTASSLDLPQRHQSMRAVFEHSWQMLSPSQQQIVRQLSVFRGGFARAAAAHVAGASLSHLARLVDTSLVRYQPGERYHLHELLRQYAAEKSSALPREHAKLLERHSAYYSDFLYGHVQALQGGDQRGALLAIDGEIENIHAAWQWLLDQANLPRLTTCLEALFLYYDLRGWAKEGAAAFGGAVEQLGDEQSAEHDLLLARLRARQARFVTQLSDFAAASSLVQHSLAVFERAGTRLDQALALNQLGEIAWQQGEYKAAKHALEQSLALYQTAGHQRGIAIVLVSLGMAIHSQGQYREAQQHYADGRQRFCAIGDRWGEAGALHRLGFVAHELGNYGEAEQHYQTSLAIKRELGDRWGTANSLNNLGLVFCDLGQYDAAEQCFGESLAIREQLGNRWGIASTLNNLGLIASSQADYVEAQRLYQQSLALCQEISDQRGRSIALNNLGEVAFATGNYAQAQAYHQQSLELCRAIGNVRGTTFTLCLLGDASLALEQREAAEDCYIHVLRLGLETQAAPRLLHALVGLAALLAQANQGERAVELLVLALAHPAGETSTRTKAHLLLESLASVLPDGVIAQAQAQGKNANLELITQAILAQPPAERSQGSV